MKKAILSTERLVLREFALDDIELLHNLDSDPDVLQYLGRAGPPAKDAISETIGRVMGMYPKNRGLWALLERSSGEFMGWIHFLTREGMANDMAELGYRLRKQFWKHGFATEASRAMLAKGFEEWGVNEVIAKALAANAASIRVMAKCGMCYKETWFLGLEKIDECRRAEFAAPESRRMATYAITKTEWIRSRPVSIAAS